MKKAVAVYRLIILIITVLLLVSCSEQKPDSQEDVSSGTEYHTGAEENPIATPSDTDETPEPSLPWRADDVKSVIRSRYSRDEVEVYEIEGGYILTKATLENYNDFFHIWNLEEGTVVELFGSGYADVYEIIDKNHIVIADSGKNSESVSGSFPYLITFTRESEDESFTASYEPQKVELSTSIDSGSKYDCEMLSLSATDNGIEVLFGPSKAVPSGGDFYIAATDLPVTTIFYEEETNTLKIKFTTDEISSSATTQLSAAEYYEKIAVEMVGDALTVSINFKENVKYYSAESKTISEDDEDFAHYPYLIVSFYE